MRNNYTRVIRYFIYSLLVLIAFNAVYFGYIVHSSYIRADMWRFMDLYLFPINNNTFHMSLLWSDLHPDPLVAISFILSYVYSDLTINYFFYIGIVSKILFIYIFTLSLFKSIRYNLNFINILGVILIYSVFFSLKSVNEYAWSLVMFENNWFFALISILYYVDYFKSNRDWKNFIIFSISIFLFLVFFGDYAIISIGSMITFIVIMSIYTRNYKITFLYIMPMILSLLLYKLFFILFGIESVVKSHILFSLESFNFIGFINNFVLAIASGLFNMEEINNHFGNFFVLISSYLISLTYVSVFYIYMKNRYYKITIIPPVLMLVSLLFILSVLLYRYYPMNSSLNWFVVSPRYIKEYELGIISMLWGMIVIINNTLLSRKKYFFSIITSLFVFLIIVNIYYIVQSWYFSVYIENTNKKTESILLKFKKDQNITAIPTYVKGKSCTMKKLNYLIDNKLNVFSDKYNKNKGYEK